MSIPTLPHDFDETRKAFISEIIRVTGLDQNHVIMLEPEQPNQPRPSKPYFGMKITTPAAKSGDDSRQNIGGTIWNSGGVRKMTISFECYGNSHEEAYNYMGLWQTALDLQDVQARLRLKGIAVWIIGTVADLSQLLNTGYEGRSHMDCFFGIAMNLQSDLGSMEHVEVIGKITTDTGDVVTTDVTIP